MVAERERLRVPAVLIERQGKLYGALDPNEVEEEKARRELFFYTAYWRLLARRRFGRAVCARRSNMQIASQGR